MNLRKATLGLLIFSIMAFFGNIVNYISIIKSLNTIVDWTYHVLIITEGTFLLAMIIFSLALYKNQK